jgi:murein DD-endopeptidase MepM/ murein hydrolase activator NlpD
VKKSLILCALAAVALSSLSCSGRNAKLLETASKEVLNQTPKGRKILGGFERYRKLANIFKKYHDSKTLDDSDLLAVLRETGVIKDARLPAGTKPGKPFSVPKYAGKYRWPMDAGIVSSEFGPRWGKQHQGLDIAADMGVPIRAIAPGEVIYSGDQITGYGNVIIVRHDEQTTTTYAHNQTLKARKGDKVKAGQLIALLGSTGHSTGPHLHFEFRAGNAPVNPRTKLPKTGF